MNKNLFWKVVLIVVFIGLAMLELYPPQKTLKLGLDLAGGTSIIYDIDTRNLDSSAKRDLAERTIKVLRRRIDPTNMMNLEWVAQGNSRIEIKMPLASPDIVAKRRDYNQVLETLETQNVNLAIVRRALGQSPDKRQAEFEKFARGSQTRLDILQNLAENYDQLIVARTERDALAKKVGVVQTAVESAGIDTESLQAVINEWIAKDANGLQQSIEDYAKLNDPNTAVDTGKVLALTNYADAYKNWADVVNRLTNAEDGLNTRYYDSLDRLEELNLSISQITDVLELDAGSAERISMIGEMLEKYPERKEKIEKAVAAFDQYRPYRGRLDGPEDLKRMLKGAGVLEFRILPSPGDENFSQAMAQNYVDKLQKKGPQAASDNKYVWVEIENIDDWKAGGSVSQPFGKKHYVLASNLQKERLLVNEQGKEWKLKSVRPTSDRMGRPAISFTFDAVAGNLFYRLTSNNLQRPLCILLDGLALSAPNINSAISTHGIIEGKFTGLEVQDMVSKLDAGSLKARLIEPPVSENTIGPGIGEDNREKGKYAAMVGMAAVAAFMVIYYIGPGIIAVIALALNLLFVLAIMAFSNATFTLPGIAGIILTIGMSVDANVLIFERIREELEKGSSLKVAIANGYQRALRTILDANITTFITAAILFYVASEEIKGFAITLMLGIVSSMFTALFVTRVIFQLLAEAKILRDKLPMMKLIRKPKFAWMSAKPMFLLISAVFVIGGLAIFFTRNDQKNSKYDIEFTGGTSVTISLKDGISLGRDDIEEMIHQQGQKMNNPLLQRAKVYSVGETGSEYQISTIETNKAAAQITFSDGAARTAEDVRKAVVIASGKIGQGLDNLSVSQSDDDAEVFIVSTSNVNKSLVADILDSAFSQTASISDVQVDEVVSRAIKEVFADKLKVLENLDPKIVSTELITIDMVDKYPEIAQFLGGVKIQAKIAKQIPAIELEQRFQDMRFKPDLAELTRNPYKLLLPNYADIAKAADGKTDTFILVSVKEDTAGQELSSEQFDKFAQTENARIIAAGRLETSLSRVNQIAPSIGRQAKTQAIIAVFLSLCAIVGYVWMRFGTARYGFAAIAALVHDVCITLGAVVVCTYIAGTPLGAKLGIQDFKINLETIAAFLTIIGYSLNDTIVVFDRIRENRGKSMLSAKIINDSINQTLSRTILTSFTTFMVVFIMYVWGGAGLRGFTFAMLIGIVVGTYSSIAIAAPILIFGQKK